MQEKRRFGYLVSQYPAVSHTFILREIQMLRSLGFDISVASINTHNLPNVPEEEKNEIEKTFYLKEAGITQAVHDLLITLITSPIGIFRGIKMALELGGTDLKKLLKNFFYFIEAIMVGRWMKNLHIAHLHIHFANPASNVGLILSKIFSFTYSMTVHGPDQFYDVTMNNIPQKIEGASFICCIGSFSRSQLMKLSSPNQWNKFEIAPLGVNPDLFQPRPLRENRSYFEILCIGRLVPTKGQHILLASLEHLLKGDQKIQLRLIGDGPDMKSLKSEVKKRKLENHVIFEGALNQKDVINAYHNADLFILPSFAEGIPVVLMEAMSMEIPCISTYVCGTPELIRHNIDGMLVIPSDVEELANTIQKLIDNPRLRSELGKAGRKRVVEKYNLIPNTQKLGEIFVRRIP